MSVPRSTNVSPIPDLPPGSALTPLSSKVWGWLRSSINALLAMSGRDGIEVHRAEAGYVIGLSKELKERIEDPVEGGGTGTLNWAGPWNSSDTFELGDVVNRILPADIAQGKAGIFVSLQDGNTNHEPPDDPETVDTWWAMIGMGKWSEITLCNPDTGEAEEWWILGAKKA